MPAPLPRSPVPVPSRVAADSGWRLLAAVLGLGITAMYAGLWLVGGEAVGAAFVILPILVLLSAPILLRAAREEHAFDLAGIVAVGLLLRFVFVYYRFSHAEDGGDYHTFGSQLARSFRHLDFDVDLQGKSIPGTGGMRYIAGIAEVLTGGDMFGTYLLFTFLAFLGCWFLYRAVAVALPDADHRRYALLIMLWPSMVFWPSSLGKDAWMVFTIGLASYGAARAYRRVAGGYLLLLVGLLAGSLVRPHLTLVALLAFSVAFVVGRRPSEGHVTPSSLAKVVGVVLILVLGSSLIARTESLLNLDDLSSSSIDRALTDTRERTSEAESRFDPANPRTPAGFPAAAATALFRPFPTEAVGGDQAMTALEGLFLAGLTLASLRRLATIPRRIRGQPYVTYALVYVVLWVLVFGALSNFGILVRQRTQMLPFYFVLLALTAVVARRDVEAPPATGRAPA